MSPFSLSNSPSPSCAKTVRCSADNKAAIEQMTNMTNLQCEMDCWTKHMRRAPQGQTSCCDLHNSFAGIGGRVRLCSLLHRHPTAEDLVQCPILRCFLNKPVRCRQ